MSGTDFARTMRNLPDEGLVRIAFSQDEDGYVPEAVHAAKEELDRRQITNSDLSEMVIASREDAEPAIPKQLVPLSNAALISFVIFGVTFPAMIIAVALGLSGYTQKFKDALRAILFSFGLWGLVMLVVLIVIRLNS